MVLSGFYRQVRITCQRKKIQQVLSSLMFALSGSKKVENMDPSPLCTLPNDAATSIPALELDNQKKSPEEKTEQTPQKSCKPIKAKDMIYELNLADIKNIKIKPIHRKKLFLWLMKECMNKHFSRRIYALTCYYIDLYFQKVRNLRQDDYQKVAIVCLRLAVKIEISSVCIPCTVYPKDELITLQQRILLKLKFNLHPPIYISIIDEILDQWDRFLPVYLPHMRYLTDKESDFSATQLLYETLDAVNLCIDSLNWNYGQLTINLFFILSRFRFERKLYYYLPGVQLQKIVDNFYCTSSPHLTFFIEFIQKTAISQKEYFLDSDVGMFLLSFLYIRPQDATDISEKPFNHQKPKNRYAQTLNKNASRIASQQPISQM